ncbi:MAG: enoyl-CoA hydratase-related protein [Pseudomonadota bacterium]
MTDDILLTDINDKGVARLTINRPDVRNAFNEEIIDAISGEMDRLGDDDNTRVIVLTGAGKAFSAGADLSMMKAAGASGDDLNKKSAGGITQLLMSIYKSPKPTVARVNGAAIGGGLGIVAACDIAVGSQEAIFALSEARLGLLPAVISPFVVEAIGARNARRFFLTAERFDAAIAAEIGLLHMTAPANGLDEAVDGVVNNLLASGPNAIRECKDLIERVKNADKNDELMRDLEGRIARLRASDEGQEGLASFLQKRKPAWVKD